jgi:hypothetical protein
MSSALSPLRTLCAPGLPPRTLWPPLPPLPPSLLARVRPRMNRPLPLGGAGALAPGAALCDAPALGGCTGAPAGPMSRCVMAAAWQMASTALPASLAGKACPGCSPWYWLQSRGNEQGLSKTN